MRKHLLTTVVVVAMIGGTLAVASLPAGATSVGTEAQLRAAFADDAQVDLTGDITLSDCSGPDVGAVVRANTNTDAVTLDGHGFTITQTCQSNVLIQYSTASLSVRDVTITGGDAKGSGGGVYTVGDLTVDDSVITGNSVTSFGGGLVSNGVLVVRRSSIVGNRSGKGGGGIQGNIDTTIIDSDVSGNINGGIATDTDPGRLTVVNTTIDDNTLGGLGGAIFARGTTTLVYVTITDNTATQAFASLDVETLSSFGTVVTNSAAKGNCLIGPDSVSLGYNFSDDATCGFTASTDRQTAGDPLLGALASNGGPTQTRLPQAGSPLLNAIPAVACAPDVTTDQRGVTRPQAGSCDIGAVEVEALPLTALTPAATPIPVAPRFTG
jgi:hypothetical protein